MTTPVLEYMWVKVLEDGKTIIPQFDTETGKENFWNADNVPLSKVVLTPFTVDLAEKVMQNGVAALATTNPRIEFLVTPDDKDVESGRDGKITCTDYFVCDICGWKFLHEGKTTFAKCPQCGTQDDWYCSRCKEYKTEYRITKKNQVQCLDCDIPVGLDRTKHLIRMQEVKHTCDYYIKSNNKEIVVTEDGRIII
jgi:predicted RNA-binding Zn-ribbon protein involved in translation (DUF1610 family)